MANPNPSPSTRFGAENGNASGAGKTSDQRQAEIKAAEDAAKLRALVLSEMLEKVEDGVSVLELLDSNTRNIMKDSEDRVHGTPKATTEVHGDLDMSLSVTTKIVDGD